ncbi:MAG: histidine kinase, partial [Clostridiales bacterium]|nr:histidine kinase [Clostridiales bacterium]
IAFALYLARSLNRGVEDIVHSIHLIETGQFSAVQPSDSGDEFGVLQTALHGMAVQIRTLINGIVVAESKHKDMEFRLLYEQINPHFIYNTLDVVYWEALSAGEDKLAELARTLTDYLRLSLNHGHELITVKNELEEVKKYIHIINYCYHDCVRLTISAPDEVQEIRVINTILQPLVENAVFHGILAKEEPWGNIDINVCLDGNVLTFVIIDDGVGMESDDIDQYLNSDSAHSCLRNVNKRIQSYYGSESGITYEPAHRPGSRLTIRLTLSGNAPLPSADGLLTDQPNEGNIIP